MDCINTSQYFEQNRFSFHNRECSFWANISKTKNSCSVTYYSYVVPF